MNAKVITIIILVGSAVIFFIQNVEVLELKFVFWTVSMSGALLMFLFLSAGTAMGWWLRGTFSQRKSSANAKHSAVIAK